MAEYLAPLARFLRGEVEAALATPGSNIEALANEWRGYFFPDADDAQFADAYAQTVTYAMLLARLSGAERLDPAEAAKTLDKGNRLLARALELLGQPDARRELRLGFEMLQRSLEALDPHDFLKSRPDLWLYFYEDFLARYDPKLRKDHGVYYTPREVVELQVRLVAELLETRFGKTLGFADDGVVFLDPAVGAGAYPVAAVRHGLEKVRARSGEGAVAGRAAQMAQNMHGFEVLVGPYAVAHLRLSQTLEGAGATIPGRLKLYLADALASPNKAPPGGLDLTHKLLVEEHEAARQVKNHGDILVCLGNPPYDRQHIDEGDAATRRKGGWVRFGDQITGGARQEKQRESPILADFTGPVSAAGKGNYIANLYNDYVYFWRWALWRLFEQQDTGGVVSFITASSYLSGPGFAGMREVMRRTFDDLWILDLGGDNLGTRKTPNVFAIRTPQGCEARPVDGRKTPNVFAIRTPVCIAVGVRSGSEKGGDETPARARYAKITGESREAKLEQLAALEDFSAMTWRDCPDGWHDPFLPAQKNGFFDWPELHRLFPLSLPGAKFHRTWPIGETEDLLKERWQKLCAADIKSRKEYFHVTGDGKATKKVSNKYLPGYDRPSIASMAADDPPPNPIPYGFRSFDRHHALYDSRLGDFIRPPLGGVHGAKQVYMTSLFSENLGRGPGVTASAAIPDLHHFCGRGGKDVIPLFRDADATETNITDGLLDILARAYGRAPSAYDLATYVYAVLGGQSYTKRFWSELETPGARVPLTKDGAVFAAAVKLGERLIWLHTYGERFRGDGRGNRVPTGTAKNLKGVSSEPENYPEDYAWNPETREIRVGGGTFGPVAPDVWAFEVSGLKVVQSWLDYRMKKRAGKKSSPLDDIRPAYWTARMTDEFLELLWVLEAALDMKPELSAILDRVVAGPCFTADELPTPTDAERKAPAAPAGTGALL